MGIMAIVRIVYVMEVGIEHLERFMLNNTSLLVKRAVFEERLKIFQSLYAYCLT